MRVLHVGDCSIPEMEMVELMQAVDSHGNIEVFCGVPIKKLSSITELDISGKCLGAEGAFVLASYMMKGGCMQSIDISNNSLRTEGAEYIAWALRTTRSDTAMCFVQLRVTSSELF